MTRAIVRLAFATCCVLAFLALMGAAGWLEGA